MRPTWAEIDLEIIAENTSIFCDLLDDSVELCAVVKADGYGHGAAEVAKQVLASGATWLAVAFVEEAAALRREGIEAPILILSEPRPTEMEEVVKLGGVRPTIYTRTGVDAFSSVADEQDPVHLKVDTGMHRVGVRPNEIIELASYLVGSGIQLEGLFTHFALASTPTDPFNKIQIELFDRVLEELASAGHIPQVVHQANTAATLEWPETHRSMVRVGIGLYGAEPSKIFSERFKELGLKPAVWLRSEVSYLQTVESGEGVGYGHRWKASRNTRIATIPIGYADGIFRGWWDGGEVLIRGAHWPIRGVVTMDSLIVEVDESIKVGFEVVLLGAQGDSVLAVSDVAELLGTIGHEILTSLGARIPRRY
jgi:alanine racemase